MERDLCERLMLRWCIETLHNYKILTDKEYNKIYERTRMKLREVAKKNET